MAELNLDDEQSTKTFRVADVFNSDLGEVQEDSSLS